MKFVNSIKRNKTLLTLLLLILSNVVIGIFTFRSYGYSWDEPLFYKYADAIGYAYSIQARLSGTFNLENAYGPSGTDHAIYGPAYLLIGRIFDYALGKLTGIDPRALWHLINFVTFQIGVVLLFFLSKRWVSDFAALSAALLFSTQPLLWGHAFINPKDIPFMVFFLAAMYSGLHFIDQITIKKENTSSTNPGRSGYWQINPKHIRRWFFVALFIILVLIGMNRLIETSLTKLLSFFYYADQNSLQWKTLHLFAEDINKVGFDYYVTQLLSLYHKIQIAGLAILIPLAVFMLIGLIWPKASSRFWHLFLYEERNFIFQEQDIPLYRAFLVALIPAVILGMTTSIRVLGLLAGGLVFLYYLIKEGQKPIREIIIYFGLSALVIYITWPFLWGNPFTNFLKVFQVMSNNPQTVVLLFNGSIYDSTNLPRIYLPTLLGITLTEPVWILFFSGLAFAIYSMIKLRTVWHDFLAILIWFFIPLVYVIISRPPMYDGFRHFLFILPPVFIIMGFLFDKLLQWLKRPVLYWGVIIILSLPGLVGIATLHPYEYAYYNTFVGGSSGAYRRFENDYWLTCYREAMLQLNRNSAINPTIYVMRQPSLAQIYAADGVKVMPYTMTDTLQTGDYILLSTRSNRDMNFQQPSDIRWTIGRQVASYCIVKQVR